MIYDENHKLGMLNPRTIQYDLHFLSLFQIMKLRHEKDIHVIQSSPIGLLSQRALYYIDEKDEQDWNDFSVLRCRRNWILKILQIN